MSMVSYAAGTRFLSLIGGVCLSFYDWYADLPPASPQVWGDQTDVPESADWWNAGYVILWGSNIPQTRTPDAHFMTEARYRGQKVVVVSPDYAGHTKFADHWLPAAAGTDGALALGDAPRDLQGVLRRPRGAVLPRLREEAPPTCRSSSRCASATAPTSPTASCAPPTSARSSENAEWKTVVLDDATGAAAVPNGSIGYRWGEEGMGQWNLELDEIDPALTLLGRHDELVEVDLPRFDVGETEGGGVLRRGVPAKRIGDELVTTVFDLYAAQLGRRPRRPAGRVADGATTTRPRTRPPGRRRSPASTAGS